jgi:hypothetical protein
MTKFWCHWYHPALPCSRWVKQSVKQTAACPCRAPGSASPAGAIHLVPKCSSHGTFTDLPFLVNTWMRDQLRKWVSAGVTASASAWRVLGAVCCVIADLWVGNNSSQALQGQVT